MLCYLNYNPKCQSLDSTFSLPDGCVPKRHLWLWFFFPCLDVHRHTHSNLFLLLERTIVAMPNTDNISMKMASFVVTQTIDITIIFAFISSLCLQQEKHTFLTALSSLCFRNTLPPRLHMHIGPAIRRTQRQALLLDCRPHCLQPARANTFGPRCRMSHGCFQLGQGAFMRS